MPDCEGEWERVAGIGDNGNGGREEGADMRPSSIVP